MRAELFTPAGRKDAYPIGGSALPLARVPKIERGKCFQDRPSEIRSVYGNELTWGCRGSVTLFVPPGAAHHVD